MSDINTSITYNAMCRISKALLYEYADHIHWRNQRQQSVNYYQDRADKLLADIHTLMGQGFPITAEHLEVAKNGIDKGRLWETKEDHFNGL